MFSGDRQPRDQRDSFMAELCEIVFDNSGLNSDNSLEFMKPGDSPADYTDDWGSRNIMFSPGDNNVLETILGISAIDDGYSYSQGNTPEYKGYAVDKENNKVYYFIKDTTNGENCLVEFNPINETGFDQIIWEDTALELGDRFLKPEETPVIDGWIYYNAGSYGLKKINIEFARNYTDYSYWSSGGDYELNDEVRVRDGRIYKCIQAVDPSNTDPRSDATNWEVVSGTYTYPCDSSGDLEAISLSRMNVPPVNPVTFAYDSDTAKDINNLRRKLFQFTYRFKYRNHGYSRTAPISKITLPLDDESKDGEVDNAITTNNHLDLAFQAGDLGIVEWVELFVREGNAGTWYYVKRFEDGEETYAFYNDLALEAVDDAVADTIADALPKESDAEVYISENRMLLAGNTEGFDNVDLTVTMTADTDEISLVSQGATRSDPGVNPYAITETTDDGGWFYGKFDVAALVSGISTGDYIEVYLSVEGSPSYIYSFGFILSAAGAATADGFRDQCISQINTNCDADIIAGYSAVTGLTIDDSDFWVRCTFSGASDWDDACKIEVYAGGSSVPNKWPGFKSGAHHPFAIGYYDEEFRPFGLMTSSTTTPYVPTMPEEGNVTTTSHRAVVDWTIGHTPPTEAHYWQWFYAGNSDISNFWQYILPATSAVGGVDFSAGTYSNFGSGTAYTAFDISPLIDVTNTYAKSQLSYEFVAGDRLRVITSAGSGGSLGNLVGTPVDLEIIAFDSTNNYIVVAYDASDWGAGNSSLIEIYRPTGGRSEETLYYSIGAVYDIYTSGSDRFHRGQTVDQSDGVSAEGTLVDGDAYYGGRAFSVAVAGGSVGTFYPIEAPSYSDFYASDDYSYGKVNLESDKGEVTLTDIRWSNPYFQDTNINGLSTYDAYDYISIPEKYGDIRALRQLGDVLKVYTDDKAVSVWIGKTEYFDASGESQGVMKSESVLGSIRPQIADLGTTHRESICQTDNYIYGYDFLKGVAWRDGTNGQFPISGSTKSRGEEYKMFKWFRDKAGQLRSTYASDEVHVDYDDYYEVVFYYFKTNTPGNTEVVAFHEPSNRWVSFVDHKAAASPTAAQIPDGYMRYDGRFYSFLDGVLYKHNDTSAEVATFYGTKHDVLVDFVMNDRANLVKLLNSIILHTDGEWTVDDLEIPASLNYPNGMVSKIPSTEWEKREGKYQSHFLRNMKTRSGSATALDLRQGEELRGNVVYIRLKNTQVSRKRIFKVDIYYDISNV